MLTETGDFSLEYLYVKDAAKGTILALKSAAAKSHTFNIGTGKCTSVKKIVEITKRLFPDFVCKVGGGLWSNDMLNAWISGPLDLTRAQKELRYTPDYDIGKGMSDLSEWERRNPTEYESWPKNDLWLAA